MTSTYAMAYTEVLEILKYLPKEEYSRIPKEKIKFYEENKDNNYIYKFDISKSINEQNISRKTNSIIVSLFIDYFATLEQKEKIQKKLVQNEEIYQRKIKELYNLDNIFKNRNTEISNVESQKAVKNNINLVEYNAIPWYRKILNKIKEIFNI